MFFSNVWAKDYKFLYEMLSERPQCCYISHKKMPTYAKHIKFVRSKPYRVWYIINVGRDRVGNCYVTNDNEIGIFILKRFQGLGYAKCAIKILVCTGGSFLANINPKNLKSIKLFKSLGFKHIQNTYQLDVS